METNGHNGGNDLSGIEQRLAGNGALRLVETVTETVMSAPSEADADVEQEMVPGRGPSKLLSGSACEVCGGEQAAIRINVDGNTLLMESCDGCDIRRWQLAGERIDLQEALNQVGEHSGRRR